MNPKISGRRPEVIVTHADPKTMKLLAKHVRAEEPICPLCSGRPGTIPFITERAKKAEHEWNLQSATQTW